MKLKKKNLHIAIDGPVASGKSVGAKMLSKKLDILYVYSGAMYRAVAFLGLSQGLDLTEEKPLTKLLKANKIELKTASKDDRFCDVLLNGQDITDMLFSSRINWGSSQVGVFPKVREILVSYQKQITSNNPVVMEGRDITTVVLPKADLKIYMTADLKTRAKRRQADLKRQGESQNLKQVIESIKKRDYQDIHRQTNPLKIAPDAWVIDTTDLTIKQEVDLIINRLKEMNLVV
jgi:CMP/dCMP kinase